MKCPNCQDETSVVRTIKYETVVIRCRYCQRCKCSFSTHEEAVVFKAIISEADFVNVEKIAVFVEKQKGGKAK